MLAWAASLITRDENALKCEQQQNPNNKQQQQQREKRNNCKLNWKSFNHEMMQILKILPRGKSQTARERDEKIEN